jgi:prophage maintenance system killer protein
MITLEVADLVVIAARALGLDTGQVLDLLDATAAEFALAQARPGRDPGDLAGQAAVLLDALVRGQPLRRGNRQVALAAMLQFLALNGQEMDPDPPGPVAALVAGLAAGTLNVKTVADRLAPRLRPAGQPAARVKEAPMPGRPVTLAMRIKKATMRTQPKGLFGRFTDRARLVVFLAQEEARLLRHDYVGTEHLLLALLYEGEGIAAKALDALGISRELALAQAEEITGRGQGSRAASIPLTPPAKKALELSLREALALGHHYIGTEHILLGLLREGEDVAAQVLTRLGAGYDIAREQVLGLLSGESGQAGPQAQLAADLAGIAEQLTEVRRQKQAAFDAGDLDSAARLRDRDRQLLAGKLRLESLLTDGEGGRAVIAEYQRLHRELDRLRGLLHEHGIDPDGGTARTA